MVLNGCRPRDSYGRFEGEHRLRLESVPRLPAWLLGRIMDFAADQTIELRWYDRDGLYVQFAKNCLEPGGGPAVGIRRRLEAEAIPLVLTRFEIPNRGHLTLVRCSCGRLVRHLYPWRGSRTRAYEAGWNCRICSRLRYSSEGSRNRGSAFWGPYPRPWVWGDPESFVVPL